MTFDVAAAGLVVAVVGILVAILVALFFHSRQAKLLKDLHGILDHLTLPASFIEACGRIHSTHGQLRVLAHTPGLLLPTERDAEPQEIRRKYFGLIQDRLLATGEYRLRYLFDYEEYRAKLRTYLADPDSMKGADHLQDAEAMFRTAVARTGDGGTLELKYISLADSIPSMVIGGEDISGVGYRPKGEQRNTEWVIIKLPALVKIVRYQFDRLFDMGKHVTPEFFGQTVLELRRESREIAPVQ